MRLLIRLLLPLVPWAMLAVAIWRRISRREPREALAERLGYVRRLAKDGSGNGPTLWLHGASNGELASANWVLQALLKAQPGLQVLVTTNTATARAMAAGWGLPGVTVAFAPLDLNGPLRRLLQAWTPAQLITVEAEIYPRRFALCARAGVKVVLIGARMSERSFRGWQDLQPVMAKALSVVTMASTQDQASAGRLLALGLQPGVLRDPCDLKAVAIGLLAAPMLPPQTERTRWLLAASTHAGEEAVVLDAFMAARDRFDHLILAPRHPRRAGEIAALIAARGLAMTARTSGAMPGETVVFLADTMGEMDRWYARCGACIVGGSFVRRGGHTPWEPVRFGCAVLHGPSVENFVAPYAALDSAGGALALAGPAQLADALAGLDGAAQARLAAAAAQILTATGRGDDLIDEIMMLLGAKADHTPLR